MGRTGVADSHQIEGLLRQARPYYNKIREVELGSGMMGSCRNTLQALYDGLGGVTDNVNYFGGVSSIVGKSKTLLAIWGQVPGFDKLTRKRLVVWTHLPEPRKLPHLRASEIWYTSHQFCDMAEELDKWVVRWPKNNGGRVFANSFIDLCAGSPVGHMIDMIYNWELPDPRIDC